jgi:hypothetical protein
VDGLRERERERRKVSEMKNGIQRETKQSILYCVSSLGLDIKVNFFASNNYPTELKTLFVKNSG